MVISHERGLNKPLLSRGGPAFVKAIASGGWSWPGFRNALLVTMRIPELKGMVGLEPARKKRHGSGEVGWQGTKRCHRRHLSVHPTHASHVLSTCLCVTTERRSGGAAHSVTIVVSCACHSKGRRRQRPRIVGLGRHAGSCLLSSTQVVLSLQS